MDEQEPLHAREMHFGRLLCTVFHEAEEDQDVIFLANNFRLVTMLIAAIIKKRRQVGLFYERIEQQVLTAVALAWQEDTGKVF